MTIDAAIILTILLVVVWFVYLVFVSMWVNDWRACGYSIVCDTFSAFIWILLGIALSMMTRLIVNALVDAIKNG